MMRADYPRVGMLTFPEEDQRESETTVASVALPYGLLLCMAQGVAETAEARTRAARAGLKAARRFFQANRVSSDDSRGMMSLLRQALREANAELYALSREQAEVEYGFASILLVLVAPGRAFAGHLGDCRLYLVRRGAASRITRDHTMAQTWIDHGILTDEQIRERPDVRKPQKLLGARPECDPDIRSIPVQMERGDALVLCNAGIHESVDDDELAGMASSLDPELGAEQLCDVARTRGKASECRVVIYHSGPPLKGGQPRVLRARRMRTRRQVSRWLLAAAVAAMLLAGGLLLHGAWDEGKSAPGIAIQSRGQEDGSGEPDGHAVERLASVGDSVFEPDALAPQATKHEADTTSAPSDVAGAPPSNADSHSGDEPELAPDTTGTTGTAAVHPGEAEKPVDAAPKPMDGAARPMDGAAVALAETEKPADGVAKPVDGAAKPADGAAKPVDVSAKPADGVARPVDGAAKPVDVSAKPADGVAKPVDGAAGKPEFAPKSAAVSWPKPPVVEEPSVFPFAEPVQNGMDVCIPRSLSHAEAQRVKDLRILVNKGYKELQRAAPDPARAGMYVNQAGKVLGASSKVVTERCSSAVELLQETVKVKYLRFVWASSTRALSNIREKDWSCARAHDRAGDARKFGATEDEIKLALRICATWSGTKPEN